jgi:hypothetical protein
MWSLVSGPPHFAIALQVHRPTDFFLWLDHHRRLGVEEFHILADDSPDLEMAVAAAAAKDCHVTTRTPTNFPQQSQVDRQIAFVNRVLERTRARWLIHVDADELLEGDLGWLELLPAGVAAVKLENEEAVYAGTERHCFAATEFVRCGAGAGTRRCRSYVNGKVAIRCGTQAKLWGAHDATVPALPAPFSVLRVRHYESCTFAAWAEKMVRVARTGQAHARPFPFYGASAAALLPAYELWKDVTGAQKPAERRDDQETGPHCPTCKRALPARQAPSAPLLAPLSPHPSTENAHQRP